ncbi:MAG: DUF4340 domain-containing protein [Myxococcota bacterium]
MTLVKQRLIGLAIAMVLALLAGALVIWQRGKTERQARAEKAREKVLALEKTGDVQKLELKTGSEMFVVERQSSGGWSLTAPLSTAADETTIDGILSHLVQLERTREVGAPNDDGTVTPPEDLVLFGLAPPRRSIKLTSADGSSEELQIGKKTQFDGSLYVKRPDAPAVLMVPGALEYQVDKNLFELREKRLAVFDQDAVTRMSVTLENDSYTVERDGEEFQITAPKQARADRGQIVGILSALADIRAKAFISEKATDAELAARGLAKPKVRVELALGEDESALTFLFGEKTTDAGETAHYATRPGGHPLIELSSDWVMRKLDSRFDDLRDKRLVAFNRDDVVAVTITKGETTLRFEKRRDGNNHRDVWRMIQPEAKPARASVITGLLYRLWSLKARRIEAEGIGAQALAALGFAEPEIRVALAGKDGVELGAFLFGPLTGGERLAMGEGSERLDVIDDEIVRELSVEPGDYIETDDSQN